MGLKLNHVSKRGPRCLWLKGVAHRSRGSLDHPMQVCMNPLIRAMVWDQKQIKLPYCWGYILKCVSLEYIRMPITSFMSSRYTILRTQYIQNDCCTLRHYICQSISSSALRILKWDFMMRMYADTKLTIDTLRPRQNCRHFADDIFKRTFLNENIWISTKFLLKFVPKCPFQNSIALVQKMAWRRIKKYLVCKRYVLYSISNELCCVSREKLDIEPLDGMKLVMVMRIYSKLTHFNICCQQYGDFHLLLISRHSFYSRIHAQLHGIIQATPWSVCHTF